MNTTMRTRCEDVDAIIPVKVVVPVDGVMYSNTVGKSHCFLSAGLGAELNRPP